MAADSYPMDCLACKGWLEDRVGSDSRPQKEKEGERDCYYGKRLSRCKALRADKCRIIFTFGLAVFERETAYLFYIQSRYERSCVHSVLLACRPY